MADNVVRGNGQRFDLTLENSVSVTEIPIEEIAAMESYQTPVSVGATTAASAASTIGITAAALVGVVLIFGSCPTVYSFDADSASRRHFRCATSIASMFDPR